MKKVIPLLLIIILLSGGCSAAKESLGNNNWKFSRIVESQTDTGAFVSEKDSVKYKGAKVIDLSCSANENEITIKDNATGNEWKLGYAENKTVTTNNTDGSIFDITYTTEDKTVKGFATTGIANTNGEGGSNYLIINFGGYELYFNDIEEIKIG